MRVATLTCALTGLAACAPMVTHPPRTDPGVYLGVTGGTPVVADSALLLAMTPIVSPYLRVADRYDNGWGTSAGLAATFAARYGLQADLYAEVPARSAGWAHGVGLIAGGNYTMPYLQAGRQDEAGSGWYLTAGYALRGYQESSANLGSDDADVRPRYWSATLTGRRARRLGAMEAYLSAALGHYDHRVVPYLYEPDTVSAPPPVVTRRRLWTVALGLTMESNLGRTLSRYPGPLPPRRPPPTPPPVPLP